MAEVDLMTHLTTMSKDPGINQVQVTYRKGWTLNLRWSAEVSFKDGRKVNSSRATLAEAIYAVYMLVQQTLYKEEKL